MYADLADELMREAELYGTGSLTGTWIDEFRETPVFREYHKFYQTGDPMLLQFLLSFLLFGKKLKYKSQAWHEVAFCDWVENEENLRNLSFDRHDTDILRGIVTYLMSTYYASAFHPRFGGGAVAERGVRGDLDKVKSFVDHPFLDIVRERSLDKEPDREFARNQFSFGKGARTGGKLPRLASRLKFVPKSITSARSICMEPNAVMFTQQAVLRWFREAMDDGPISQFVDLRDQSINRVMAHYGSYTGDIDTLDLKSASDLVSFQLVKRIFPKRILHDLALTRTTYVELPGGKIHKMVKFAPMGSALCFPVQCIIFTSISVYAAMLHSGWLNTHSTTPGKGVSPNEVRWFIEHHFSKSVGYIHPNLKLYQPLCVYGDDICVDSRLTDTLTTLLLRFGFKVNVNKTFAGSKAIRESCGGYYFAGYDVTPIRYSLPGKTHPRDAVWYASCIALTNRAGDMSFLSLRKFLLNSVIMDGARKMPFLFTERNDLPYGLTTKVPRNDHLRLVTEVDKQPKGAHNRDYQHEEVQCFTFAYEQSQISPGGDYDIYLYGRWWATRTDESKLGLLKGSRIHRVTAGSRLKLVWFPV